MAKSTKQYFAKLKVPKIPKEEKPWLGWNIVFEKSVSKADIRLKKPQIERALNQYLESSLDAAANKLVIPFTNKMVGTADNPLLYKFKIDVYEKGEAGKKVRHKYSADPIKKLNGHVLEAGSLPGPPPAPSDPHVNTVAIKPPPN